MPWQRARRHAERRETDVGLDVLWRIAALVTSRCTRFAGVPPDESLNLTVGATVRGLDLNGVS